MICKYYEMMFAFGSDYMSVYGMVGAF